MQIVPVKLGSRSYNIYVGEKLANAGRILKDNGLTGKRAMIIGDNATIRLYGKKLKQSLNSTGCATIQAVIQAGEKSKSINTVVDLYKTAAGAKLERLSPIIALGGGVVGDIAGFFAATYLRGLPFVQVPTTLLAMVDASIGGKTGVDLPWGKNLVGAIYQPKLVISDLALLGSLPEKEWMNGLAEIVKYGVIADKKLFETLEKTPLALLRNRSGLLEKIVAECCHIKARVISEDELETKGRREILNFGHTIGHAIEASGDYTKWSHGEAVAIGMAAAAIISEKKRLWPQGNTIRLKKLLGSYGLPVKVTSPINRKTFVQALLRDKKARHGKLRFVLPARIGRVIIRDDIDSPTLEFACKTIGLYKPLWKKN